MSGWGEMTEVELLELVQRAPAGETVRGRDALEELLGRHYEWMLRLCLLELRDNALAVDCAQEALVQAAQSIRAFRGRSSLKTWLFVIVKRRIARFRRKELRFRERFVAVEPEDVANNPDPSRSVERQLLATEENRRLAALVKLLPENQRFAVWLHYFEDLSIEQCAERIGCKASTVKTHLFRARSNLKSMIEQQAPDLLESVAVPGE
ncbi:MAG: RNA polymerase sigma factor [Bdellovibrionales bacterium]|nr:RNA polymerase sigma factor [Bdellovibrionales bacterium]